MPCDPWPVAWPCPPSAETDPQLVALAVESATSLLWALSGRRVGVCDWFERFYPPCTAECGEPYKDADGEWRNRGSAAATCCRLLLTHRPVQSITEVRLHGEVLDSSAYQLSRGYLLRTGACWPCEDECYDPPIEVDYRAGVPFPPMTGVAVGEVATEFLASYENKPCRLPSRATTITRQGVTVELAPLDTAVQGSRLGLPIADAWLTTVNPNGLQQPSRVYSPDLARRG